MRMHAPERAPETPKSKQAEELSGIDGMRLLHFFGLNNNDTNSWFLRRERELQQSPQTGTEMIEEFLREELHLNAEDIPFVRERMVHFVPPEKRIASSTMIPLDSDALEHDVIIADKLLIRPLGTGATGLTYLIFDITERRYKAIKIPRRAPEKGSQEEKEWRRSNEIAQRVYPDYPRGTLKSISDAKKGRNTVYPYMEMPYFNGGTFTGLIEHQVFKEIKNPDDIIQMLCLVTHSIEKKIHGNNIIHHDIKPENILVRQDGGVAVVDFDSAKLMDEKDPPIGEMNMKGTASYIAPEQAMDWKASDKRADIYAWGAVMIHAITGKPPYGAPGSVGIRKLLMMHQVTPVPSDVIKTVEERVGKEAALVILKCMSKKPDDRYSSMAEVGDALWQCLKTKSMGHVQSFADLLKMESPKSPVLFKLVQQHKAETSPKHYAEANTIQDEPASVATDETHKRVQKVMDV